MTEDEFIARQAQLIPKLMSKGVLVEIMVALLGSHAAMMAQKKDLEQGWPGLLGAFLGLAWVVWLSFVMWFGILYIGCFVFSTLSLVFRERLAGRRLLEEASRAASLLVWSKRDDGSVALIGVPLNVDGTRGEAPQDAEEWISVAFCLCAALGVEIGIAAWTLGVARTCNAIIVVCCITKLGVKVSAR